MNILLENVIYEDGEEHCFKYDTLYVKGRNIRYIHIPKHVSRHFNLIFFAFWYFKILLMISVIGERNYSVILEKNYGAKRKTKSFSNGKI